MKSNVNYNRFTNKLLGLPWITDITGFYRQIEFDFSNITLDELSKDLVIGSVALSKNDSVDVDSKKKKEHITISFYQSVNTVSINHFLHFIDNCGNPKIGLNISLKHIEWDILVQNGIDISFVTINEQTKKLIGKSPGGKPLL